MQTLKINTHSLGNFKIKLVEAASGYTIRRFFKVYGKDNKHQIGVFIEKTNSIYVLLIDGSIHQYTLMEKDFTII